MIPCVGWLRVASYDTGRRVKYLFASTNQNRMVIVSSTALFYWVVRFASYCSALLIPTMMILDARAVAFLPSFLPSFTIPLQPSVLAQRRASGRRNSFTPSSLLAVSLAQATASWGGSSGLRGTAASPGPRKSRTVVGPPFGLSLPYQLITLPDSPSLPP